MPLQNPTVGTWQAILSDAGAIPATTTDAADYAKRWAMTQTLAEARAMGINTRHAKTDAKLAAKLTLRFAAWLSARFGCTIYEAGRWLPGWRDPFSKIFEQATMAGKLLSNPKTANDPRVAKFIASARKHPPTVWSRFLREAYTPHWIKPKHPDLDEWLIMIWPLVEYHDWNCTDIITIGIQRFPDLAGKYPLTTGEDLGKHIRKSLNKHLRGFGSTPNVGLKLPKPGKRPVRELPAALVKFALHIQK